MQFDSFSFVLVLVALFVVDRGCDFRAAMRNRLLLVASYGFYATWSPLYLPFLLGSTLIDFWVAHRLAACELPRRRQAWLLLSLVVNFSLLGWFKYAGFVHESLVELGWLDAASDPTWGAAFVPLGISFFTFQTVSYTIDVYHRRLEPTANFREFALYVSFFPQLVAGPIVRAGELLPQLRAGVRASLRQISLGATMVAFGLFQKIVLADTIFRPVAEQLFDGGSASARTLDHWLAVFAFWGQLYCDFSGYSTMAIGMAACLGFCLPQNFRCPFAAQSLAEFWRRWHMTLTRWFGTYLYQPLGGRRCSPLRSAANVLIVMGVAGLWHGASWTFVAWGLVHGLGLIVERVGASLPWPASLRSLGAAIPGWLRAAFVFFLVGNSCILFRAHDLAQAAEIARAMYGFGATGGVALFGETQLALVGLTLALAFQIQWWMRERDVTEWFERLPVLISAPAIALLLFTVLLFRHHPTGYLYFQF